MTPLNTHWIQMLRTRALWCWMWRRIFEATCVEAETGRDAASMGSMPAALRWVSDAIMACKVLYLAYPTAFALSLIVDRQCTRYHHLLHNTLPVVRIPISAPPGSWDARRLMPPCWSRTLYSWPNSIHNFTYLYIICIYFNTPNLPLKTWALWPSEWRATEHALLGRTPLRRVFVI